MALYLAGHAAIDQRVPQAWHGLAWYLPAVALAIAAAWVGYWVIARPHRWGFALLAAAPLAALLAYSGEFYALGRLSYLPAAAFAAAWAVLIALAMLQAALRPWAVPGALMLVASVGGAALYHLATVGRQAELARQSHDTPALAIAAFLVVFALARVR
jgi:hypothetical protein